MPHRQTEAPGVAGLRRLLAARYERPASDIQLKAGQMRGGLMAELLRVSAARPGAPAEHFVVKRTTDCDGRERAAYDALASCGLTHLAPRLLGTSEDRSARYLVLEYVARWKAWPWTSEAHTGMVLELLAELHNSGITQPPAMQSEYETQLQQAALDTLALFATGLRELREPRLARGAAAVRTLACRLTEARGLLLRSPVFLHGDVHTGNVLMRAAGRRRQPVLLDWGRARMGSRFEDVASWLQCLRYFDPAAAAAHDRLLLRYIRAAGLGDHIEATHRREYWIAAGCNALAGALGVHITSALAATTPRSRERAVTAAADWLRIVRRALVYLERVQGGLGDGRLRTDRRGGIGDC